MKYRCLLRISLFILLASPALAQVKSEGRFLHFTSSHTSFPDTGRAGGHLYDSILYTAAEHYNDSTVLLFIPNYLHPGQKIDLIFWFHGWHNNIDTAIQFYELAKQLAASGRNAILVLAETAKNAPDSYGGRLEQPGMFKGLVNDVMKELEKNNIVAPRAEAGNIVLTGHSGAFRVIACILQNGQMPVQEVFLFDALYSQLDKYITWINDNAQHHFVHWFTNRGGGTDKMSDTMMQQLKDRHIGYLLTEEQGIAPSTIESSRVLFVHSPREHNVIINNPDDFRLLLSTSFILRP